MLREFESPIHFAEHLLRLQVGMRVIVDKAFDTALAILEKDMRDQIGEYQDAVGPYNAWAPLAESTEADKAAQGFPLNAPLLRTGELRESFAHEREGDEGIVGATDPVMEYQEFGTATIPPRPVVGPALERNRDVVERLLGRALVDAILGGQIDRASNYFGPEIKPE